MACDHLSMLGLELNHVDKGAPGVLETNTAMASAGYTDYRNIDIVFFNVCFRFIPNISIVDMILFKVAGDI